MSPTKPSSPAAAPGPRRRQALGILALLGTLAALWSLFLWRELVTARSGGVPTCAFGQEGCAALWDGGFASAVHDATGVPIAGWGLVWGLVAFLLPLAALVGAPEGRHRVHLDSAVVVTGIAGGLGVLLMLAASVAARLFCSSCAITYVLTVAYAVVAMARLLADGARPTGRGVATAAGVTLVAYLALLYPGLRTPGNVQRSGEEALAAAAAAPPAAATPPAGAPASPGAAPSPPAGAADVDGLLRTLIANLEPAARQALSDSLYLYSSSHAAAARPPRALHGNPAAPVRLTEFSDVLCGHCADLQQTIRYLEEVLPPGSFAVDGRNFPLDGNCNRHLQARGPESVRCYAARARICLDGDEGGRAFTASLFARQGELTPDLVRQLAAPYTSAAELDRCLASPATAQALATDVDYAWEFEPDGTPLVLVNGRQGTSFGPFLYAMILTGGDPRHPALATLPPPNPTAHIH